MTLKNASFLAFIGTALVAVLQIWDFFSNLLNVIRGLLPAVVLFTSLIYAFGALTVAVFFYFYSQSQQR